MIHDALLETEMSRAIARKSGVRLSPGLSVDAATPADDLWGQYHKVDQSGRTHSAYGSIVSYTALSDHLFPTNPQTRMSRHGDALGASEARLVVTVTRVGRAGSTLRVTIQGAGGTEGFTTGPPAVPLDSLGLHVTEWKAIAWGTIPPGTTQLEAQTRWRVSNPGAGTGTVGIGICQLQVR